MALTTTAGASAEGRSTRTMLRRGSWGKADIAIVDHLGQPAILKDFSGKAWPVRLLGHLQIRREIRALARLADVEGIPRCLGTTGPHALLMERIEGEWITHWCRKRPDGVVPMFERLACLVDAMHARGVAHADLRKRDNILVDPAGRPAVIDFNASFCFAPRGLGARILFPLLRAVDRGAILKWKTRLAPALTTPAERRRDRIMTLLRRLWIFN
ncbi:MAG TPA: lipopolysaccharide kinase InaA family protein [Candidatus Polarisedimenticolia bacterium]|nr:lipopolysaccharide kinase InaA family protein [Candidatus Polarisedimenticolia bacterium]